MISDDLVSNNMSGGTSMTSKQDKYDEEAGITGVYGNTRSKIYFLPGCKLRKPLGDRKLLFSTSGDAERSGYRLCQHCRDIMNGKGDKVITAAYICDYIKDHFSERITLSILGKKFSMGPHRIRSIFIDTVGVSPRKYIDELRITKLKEKLASGDSVTNAIYAVGHNSSSWLYTNSRSRLGMTPSRYRHGSSGEKISYSTASTEFGIMVVAYTEHGICGVTLVDSEENVMQYLEDEFPKAIITSTPDTNGYIDGVMEYINGHKVTIPLDVHGTDFQMSVWSALRKIPYGTTVTYSELASMVGKPRSARAVANACGSNPVALIVPCHRVIRKGGNLGGYGLGLDRKKKILEHEKTVRSADTYE